MEFVPPRPTSSDCPPNSQRLGQDRTEQEYDSLAREPSLTRPSIDVTVKDPNLVTWDGPDDPENPQNWSKLYKWVLITILIIATVNVTIIERSLHQHQLQRRWHLYINLASRRKSLIL
ncbi:hypothetical protein AX15_006750 [Amanita polypyramis BW_CC]|nr:hypothetical protein AX15_006750 [Amanita polypyramis BW_CC]